LIFWGIESKSYFERESKKTKKRKKKSRQKNNKGKNSPLFLFPSCTCFGGSVLAGSMFQIARLKDAAVTIKPQHLDKDPLTAIVAELEELYVDKVIADLGLVVTLYEVNSIEGGIIYAGDGAAHYEVEFRMVVFSPFVNEILVGKVYSMTDENAIRMTLGFFSDLIVLPNENGMDLEKTKWDPNKKLGSEEGQRGAWYIDERECTDESKEEDGREKNGTFVRKYIEIGQQIRVRVTQVTYPEEPKTLEELKKRRLEEGGRFDDSFAPMVVICSIGELEALGPVDDADDENDDEEEEEEEEEEE